MSDLAPTHILVLAAGASSRMRGLDKLMQPIEGIPLLRRSVMAAQNTGAKVWVTLPATPGPRDTALEGLPVSLVRVAHPERGMAESLKLGVAAIPPDCPILLFLADLPEIGTDDLLAILRAQSETPELILRATTEFGQPGHPVLFPAWARQDLLAVDGDIGARAVLAAHSGKIRAIALPGLRAVTDLDTPEAWADWRAKRGRPA